jgi:dTDP-4-amino-4,6-dideoxygalactose transaminase
MTRDERAVSEFTVDDTDWVRPRPHEREHRLVPPAVTPVRVRDLLAGLRGHLRGEGRATFRTALRSFLDADRAATYTSFRRALGACLRALASSDHADRVGTTTVLAPAFCSSDFADAVSGAGLALDRYDIEASSFSVAPETVRDRLSDALALVAVNVLGYSSEMDTLRELCADTDTVLIEALGYALGSEYDGEPLGTFGDVSVCNFQQGKPIPVGGGMVLGNDAGPTGVDLGLTDDGRPSVDPNLLTLSGYALFGRPRGYYLYDELTDRLSVYDEIEERATTHPGSKLDVDYDEPFATMSNFQGAVARRVFDRLDEHQRARARNAAVYRRELADCVGIEHVQPVSGLSNHQHVRYPLLVRPDLRGAVRDALADVGVQSTTLYDWPRLDRREFHDAARVQDQILTLPTHPYVDRHDRELIVRAIRETMAEKRPER